MLMYSVFPRFDSNGELVKRTLKIASLCGGKQEITAGMSLWQHDLVVVTAGRHSSNRSAW